MVEKRDRGQLTLKGREITPDFLALVRKAAERSNTTMVRLIVETMTTTAQDIIKGSEGRATSTSYAAPARLEDVADSLADLVRGRMDALEQRLDEREGRLADRLDRLEAGGSPAGSPSVSPASAGSPTGNPALDRVKLRRLVRQARR